jgi:hypothetical protein
VSSAVESIASVLLLISVRYMLLLVLAASVLLLDPAALDCSGFPCGSCCCLSIFRSAVGNMWPAAVEYPYVLTW